MVVDGSLSVTEIGVYSVTIRFRDGVNYCWDDNTRDPAPTADMITLSPNLLCALILKVVLGDAKTSL